MILLKSEGERGSGCKQNGLPRNTWKRSKDSDGRGERCVCSGLPRQRSRHMAKHERQLPDPRSETPRTELTG